jgi:hypothetical protein
MCILQKEKRHEIRLKYVEKLGCLGVFGAIFGVVLVIGIIGLRMVKCKSFRKELRDGEKDGQKL